MMEYSADLADWARWSTELTRIRFTVFVEEQGVPAELEIDPIDSDPSRVVHAMARDAAGEVIATGRLILDTPSARIGRMAVLKAWRGKGVGASILQTLCAEAKRRGYASVHLHAQTHACDFYASHGFRNVGEEFTEAGIAHQEMVRTL